MPIFKKVNKSYFKKWSHGMTYILGFIFADGNIICTKRNTWFLSIQITDKVILEYIKKEIKSSHVIAKRCKKLHQKQVYRLQIGSKEMCGDLIRLGLTERKSQTIIWPNVPNQFLPDFIRGYFDGDGGVWIGKQKRKYRNSYIISSFFTSGSKKFLTSLRQNLRFLGMNGGCLVKKLRGYDLKYSIRDSLILYKIMYNSRDSWHLARKKERFEKYIRLRS